LFFKRRKMADNRPITLLLQNFADGDRTALDRLIPLVYGELRRIADGYLRRERPGHTLQATALVHEAYARMVDQVQPDYRNRAHFLGVAAQVMRQILVDHARTKTAAKRGGARPKVSIDEACDAALEQPALIVEVNDAIDALDRQDPQKARLIEMRFFGGLTAEESAEALTIPVATVRRELRVAQAWLQRELDRTDRGLL
jgi:RNA polymerase sigma factor (TIGR02999 family)